MLLEEICSPIDPWGLFKKVYRLPLPFFLDSSVRGDYSFVGFDPFMIIRSRGFENHIITRGDHVKIKEDPFKVLKAYLDIYRADGYIHPLQGGIVGFLCYDLRCIIEQIPFRARRDIPIPDLFFGFYDTVYIYHHREKRFFIASTGFPESLRANRERRAYKRLKAFKKLLLGNKSPIPTHLELSTAPPFHINKNLSKGLYTEAIKRALEYIASGDIYQVNLSQRFETPLPCDPIHIYGMLREENPTSMGAFLRFDRSSILSNSPERFLRIREEMIETMPIKGTTKRAKASLYDRINIDRLRNDPKENAEHIMIVDLERNDLGRVCRYGTVKVTDDRRIETYSSLHHMVSTIKGTLRDGIHPIDAIKACFPGGSITGAPKIRAMEIIDELEPTARGLYTGSIGYIDFSGQADLNIAIRTAIVYKNRLFFQTGGGIVADSEPEKEYRETLLKAKSFFNTLSRLRRGYRRYFIQGWNR